MCGDGTLRKTSFLIEIFLIAMAAILLEISYTRIFSFKLYYYFTYLIIGIAMLGLGAGGVAAAISPGLRRAQASSVVLWSSLGAGALVPVSYLTVSLIQLNTIDFVQGAAPLLRLTIVCTSLFAPFLAIGIALAAWDVLCAFRCSPLSLLREPSCWEGCCSVWWRSAPAAGDDPSPSPRASGWRRS